MKHKLIFFILIFLFTVTVFTAPGSAADEARDTIIVILEDDRISDADLYSLISPLDSDSEVIFKYDTIFNGFAVKTYPALTEKIKGTDGVKDAFISPKYKILSTENASSPVAAESAADFNIYDTGYRGEGMVIAIIDVEFDVNHELFTLSDTTVPKLSKEDIDAVIKKGLSFNNKNSSYNKSPYVNRKIPFAYDYAMNDYTMLSDAADIHGTHVAGIIGANKKGNPETGFDGIAPEAQLILMKVGNTEESTIDYAASIAAINDAISLGADVINLSWGDVSGFSTPADSASYYYMMKLALTQGIDVVASAGNSARLGTIGEYADNYGITSPHASNPDYGLIGAPSCYDSVISAASYNSDYIRIKGHIETYGGRKIIYSESFNSFADELIKKNNIYESVFEYTAVKSDGNNRLYEDSEISYKNKIVLVEYIKDSDMLAYFKDNGAIGVIYYSNNEKNPFLRTSDYKILPVVFISKNDGLELLASEKYTLTLHKYKKTELIKNPAAGIMSYFSSWGVTPSLNLKPDITTTGGNVYSTSPGNKYQTLSGTSMASPTISGAAAVVKQYINATELRDTSNYTVRRIMMTSAEPIKNPINGVEYSPRAQGAGLLSLDNALKTDVSLYSLKTLNSKIELGDKLNNEFSLEFNVKNLTDKKLTYGLNVSIFTDAYFYDKNSGEYFIDDYSEIIKTAVIKSEGGEQNLNNMGAQGTGIEEIVLPPRGTVSVKLKVTVGSALKTYDGIFTNGFFIEGFIYLIPAGNTGVTASIPFMGYRGDWGRVPIIDDNFYKQTLATLIKIDGMDAIIPLGTNIFTETDKTNANLYAFSPNGDDYGDYLYFGTKTVRNCILKGYTIEDTAGNVLTGGTLSGYIRKNSLESDGSEIFTRIWDGRDDENRKYIYPNGKYYLSVISAADYDGAPDQIYRLPFIIDDEKPYIKNPSVTQVKAPDRKVNFNCTATDNLGIMTVRALYMNEPLEVLYEKMINFNSNKAMTTVNISIDITDFVRYADSKNTADYFYLEIVDYAMNLTVLKIFWQDYL